MVSCGGILTDGGGGKIKMASKNEFQKPDFLNGEIEVRYENGEVCIYATESGLRDIAEHCKSLMSGQPGDHIHFEDYEVLTIKSLRLG